MTKENEARPTHLLVVEQPWCWAVLAGKISVVNAERIPAQERVGTRIALGAEHLDWAGPLILEGLGVDIGRTSGVPTALQQLGVLGSVVLEGWVRHEGNGKVSEFYRPGSDVPFRKLKGLSGKIGWVLRQPRQLIGLGFDSFQRIRARWEDTTEANADLLRYAEEHGTDGLSSWHLARLGALGFRKVKAKQ